MESSSYVSTDCSSETEEKNKNQSTPKSDFDKKKKNPEKQNSSLVKYLKKICVFTIGIFLIFPSTSVQAFTYFVRKWVDIISGPLRSKNKLSAIFKGLGELVFCWFIESVIGIAYVFSGFRNLLITVFATGEKGKKAKILVACKWKAYKYSGHGANAKAEYKKISASFLLGIFVGFYTCATKENSKNQPEQKDSLLARISEVCRVSVDKNKNIKQVNILGFGRNDESPMIF